VAGDLCGGLDYLTTSSGSGNGAIGFTFPANNSTTPRTAVITVSGQDFVVTQAGAVASLSPATLTPSSAILPVTAGTGTFQLTISGAWQAVSSASWLTVTPASGSGNSTLTFNYAANTQANGRMATISVAGATFAVSQISASGLYSPWNLPGYGIIRTLTSTTGPFAVDSNGDLIFSTTFGGRPED
jgi:hypothetical protein